MESIFTLNQDSVIYAIHQAFIARSRPQGGFNSYLRYTPFLENTWEKPAESSTSDEQFVIVEKSLRDICMHHVHAIPQYERHNPIDLENISWFAHSMSALFADIDYLLTHVLGQGLSTKNEQSSKIWDLVTRVVQDVFKNYAQVFKAYVEWKLNPPNETQSAVDWNVRPPCGLLYKTQFKELFADKRNFRFNKNRDNKSRDNKNVKNSGPKDQSENNQNAPQPVDTREEKNAEHKSPEHKSPEHKSPEHKSSEHKVSDHRNSDHRNSDNKNFKNRRPAAPKELQDDVERLKPGLDECRMAIETLKNNPTVHEIPLSAQNSFVRRHQHTLVTESGLESDSRGDGTNRHVLIMRPQASL